MGRDTLEYAKFLRQKCGVLTRDWQTKEDWNKETEYLKEIIKYLENSS